MPRMIVAAFLSSYLLLPIIQLLVRPTWSMIPYAAQRFMKCHRLVVCRDSVYFATQGLRTLEASDCFKSAIQSPSNTQAFRFLRYRNLIDIAVRFRSYQSKFPKLFSIICSFPIESQDVADEQRVGVFSHKMVVGQGAEPAQL